MTTTQKRCYDPPSKPKATTLDPEKGGDVYVLHSNLEPITYKHYEHNCQEESLGNLMKATSDQWKIVYTTTRERMVENCTVDTVVVLFVVGIGRVLSLQHRRV